MRRFVDWWRNPWGKPRFLAVFTWLYLIWSILPVLIAIRFSFNDGRSRSTWSGILDTLVLGRPDLSRQERSLAPAGALPEPRARRPHDARSPPARRGPRDRTHPLARARLGRRTLLMLVPARHARDRDGRGALPGVRATFTRSSPLGTVAQLLGHVTFSISFVVIIVRGRLLSIGPEYEEAATDLGASPCRRSGLVLLPLLAARDLRELR